MGGRPRYSLPEMMREEREAYTAARSKHPTARLGGASEHMFAREFDTGIEIKVTVASSNGQGGGRKTYTARSAHAAYAYLRGLSRVRNLWFISPGSGTHTKIHL